MSPNCPICGRRDIGKIGQNRYFCPDCCHEMTMNKKGGNCFYPGEDGYLRPAGRTIDVANRYRHTT